MTLVYDLTTFIIIIIIIIIITILLTLSKLDTILLGAWKEVKPVE